MGKGLSCCPGWLRWPDPPRPSCVPIIPSASPFTAPTSLCRELGGLGLLLLHLPRAWFPDAVSKYLLMEWMNFFPALKLYASNLFVLVYAWFPKTDIKYTVLFLLQKGNQYNPLHWYRNLYWAKHFSHLLPSTLLPSGLSTLEFQNNLRPLLDPKRSSFWTTGTIFLSWTDLLARTAIFSPTPDGLFAKLWGLIDSQVTKQSRSAGHPDLRSLLSWPDF